jgi:hypothetical protein
LDEKPSLGSQVLVCLLLWETDDMNAIELVANLVTILVGIYGLIEVAMKLRRKRKADELDPPKRKDDPE